LVLKSTLLDLFWLINLCTLWMCGSKFTLQNLTYNPINAMDSYAHAVSNTPFQKHRSPPKFRVHFVRTLSKQQQFRCAHWSWKNKQQQLQNTRTHNYTNRDSAKSSNIHHCAESVGSIRASPIWSWPDFIQFIEACSWPLKAALSSPSVGPKICAIVNAVHIRAFFRWTSLGTNFPISHTILHWQQQGGKFA